MTDKQEPVMTIGVDESEKCRSLPFGTKLYAAPPAQPKPDKTLVHLTHCNFGENSGTCKYGDDNCPALSDSFSWMGRAMDRGMARRPAPTQEPRNVTSQEDAVLRAAASGTLIAKGRMAAPAQRLSDAVMELAELMGNDPEATKAIDARAWDHLLTYAPKKEPQRLSDADITSLAYDCNALPEVVTDVTLRIFVRAIEAAICPPGYVVVKADPVAWLTYCASLNEFDTTHEGAKVANGWGAPFPVYAAAKDKP